MASNYEKIRKTNQELHGTAIGTTGKRYFDEQYTERTHFIFELLQNAEDALARRGPEWNGPRVVSFDLTENQLRVSHFGNPFNEADVIGICDIGNSTKEDNLTAIGRFGIGFKSVHIFTKQPHIYSGPEDFVIDNYVWPKATSPIAREDDQTVFVLPLKSPDTDYDEIANALTNLRLDTLLFLHYINKISYSIDDGASEHYLRESVKLEDNNVRSVTIKDTNKDRELVKEWLVFSHPVFNNGNSAGVIEIAFEKDLESQKIQHVSESRLVVFFPTVVNTGLGFLIQGPYQTTTSRETVPSNNKWNNYLMSETASLLNSALCWLRDKEILDINVLLSLPLEKHGDMFDPLYESVKDILYKEALLPKLESGYVTGENAVLGRGRDLRDLLSSNQLSVLRDTEQDLAWLSDKITLDRARQLYTYIRNELSVVELESRDIPSMLSRTFLEKQSDNWILQLYSFLNRSVPTRRHQTRWNLYRDIPLIRLEDGSQVTPDPEKFFLPGKNNTDFLTVKREVLQTNEAREFLESLGLREPDLADDIIRNILPKYHGEDKYDITNVNLGEYKSDIKRIIRAYEVVSTTQKDQLINELKKHNFVLSLDEKDRPILSKPGELYFKTERLRMLLSGSHNLRFIDDNNLVLSNKMHIILKECGAMENLTPVEVDISKAKRQKLLRQRQTPSAKGEEFIDWSLQELESIIERLSSLTVEQLNKVSELLWEELIDIIRINTNIFEAKYTYQYSHATLEETEPAAFIELLNDVAWVPDKYGNLKPPGDILFDDLGWKNNRSLLDLINFKSPIIEQALKEAGMDPKWAKVISDCEKRGMTPDDFLPSEQGEDNNNLSGKETGSGREPTYAEKVSESMTPNPSTGPQKGVIYPPGGPKTTESAIQDTRRLAESERTEGRKRLTITYEPDQDTKAQSVKNEDKLRGDYRERCQICGSTFLTRAGKLNIFVPHTVKPKKHSLTNHFGNLLSLCGWHYALLDYGQWALLDPDTEEPIDKEHLPERLLDLLQDSSRETASDEGPYITILIRFYNLYLHWNPSPEGKIEEIRFTLPHREYFCQLLKSEEQSDD